MNRKERRAFKKNIKKVINSQKPKIKGAFGRSPQYIMDKKKELWKKKAKKFVQTIENKEVTIPYLKDNPDLKEGSIHVIGTKQVTQNKSEVIENKEVTNDG